MSTKKQADGQVFYWLALNLDRFTLTGTFGAVFRQEGKIELKDRKQNLGQVFRQNRHEPVLLESLSQGLFFVFNPILPSCLKNGPKEPVQRNLSRFRAQEKKPVHQPVFSRQVADASSKARSCLADSRSIRAPARYFGDTKDFRFRPKHRLFAIQV